MSMMTDPMLCAIEQHLKQIQNYTNPFTNLLVLLVGDLIQLLAICKHSLKQMNYIVKFVIFQLLLGQMQCIMF
jgi:hypothetical protein